MPSLRDFWDSGFRALHIEENISNAFADFAPYAGADEQRVVITRQASLTGHGPTSAASAAVGIPLGPASFVSSSTAVVMEESGDFTVQAREASAGCLTFSTTGHLQVDAAVRVPLPPPSLRPDASGDTAVTSTHSSPKQETQSSAESAEASASALQSQPMDGAVAVHPVAKPLPSQLRFSDFTRPVSAPALPQSGLAPSTPPAAKVAEGHVGQLEIDATLPDWDANRQSIGVRLGPAAVRVTRTFSAAATATATEAVTASQLRNSASLSEEDEDDALTRTLRLAQARKYQHTIDAAVCLPLGGGGGDDPALSAKPAATGGELVTRTLAGERIALRTAPWALTCGLQFPLDLGDTLIGVALQNDRATSVTLPYPGVQWAASSASTPQLPRDSNSNGNGSTGSSGGEASAESVNPASVACVPFPMHARQQNTSHAEKKDFGEDADLPSYVSLPYFTFRFLLVQTLASHTLVRDTSPFSSPQREDSGSTSLNASGMTHLSSSYDWRRLPTLVGVNVGLDRERLRLSAASIVHDGGTDLEVAGVLDLTPWMPRMPTLVKVGYNNVGRFAAGITSLFYETVSATLGVHAARGEQAKFGIEVKF